MEFAIIVIGTIVCMGGILAIMRISIDKYLYIAIFFAFCVCLAYIASSFQPGQVGIENYADAVWDLARYYVEISSFRGISIANLLERMSTAREPFRYALWFVLAHFRNESTLQVLSTVSALGICYYGTVISNSSAKILDQRRPHFSMRYIFLSFAILFVALDFMDMIVTCRNVIAATIMVFSIYKLYDKNWKTAYFLMFASSLLHISMWSVFLLVLFTRLFPILLKFKWILAIWGFVPTVTSNLLKMIPIPIAQIIANKISTISMLGGEMTLRRSVYSVAMMLFLALIYEMTEMNKEKDKNHETKDVIQLLCLLGIGGLGSYVTIRILFLLGMLAPRYALVLDCTKRNLRNREYILKVLFLSICLFLFIYHRAYYATIMDVSKAIWG